MSSLANAFSKVTGGNGVGAPPTACLETVFAGDRNAVSLWTSPVLGRSYLKPTEGVAAAAFHHWHSKKTRHRGLSIPLVKDLFKFLALTEIEVDTEPILQRPPSDGRHVGLCYMVKNLPPGVPETARVALGMCLCGHPIHLELASFGVQRSGSGVGSPGASPPNSSSNRLQTPKTPGSAAAGNGTSTRSTFSTQILVDLLFLVGLIGDLPLLEDLLETIDPTSAPNLLSYTTLGAARNQHCHIIRYLIDRRRTRNGNSDNYIEAKDSMGFTPLHHAILNRSYWIASKLLEWGANPNTRVSPGSSSSGTAGASVDVSPLELAVARPEKGNLVDLLLSQPGPKGDISAAAFGAIAVGNIAAVNRMLELKLLDSPTKHQSFLIAAACGHLSIVQQLISTGEVDINYKRSPTRRTALHLACQNGHGDVVECLLQASVDSKAQDWRMSTPFHLAAANGTTEVIGALLKYRAPFYALYDADKLTAQQVALRCGHFALSATLNAPVGMKK